MGSVNNQSYYEQYVEFMKKEKIFTVKFYRTYEGEGGYWDFRDEWVPGPTEEEVLEEKTFSTIESALHYADTKQESIIEEARQKYVEHNNFSQIAIDRKDSIYWLSDFNVKGKSIIHAHVNWSGCNINMDLSFNFIED